MTRAAKCILACAILAGFLGGCGCRQCAKAPAAQGAVYVDDAPDWNKDDPLDKPAWTDVKP